MSEAQQSKWYVVRSKPKQEQRAQLNLENQGIRCFLPMLTLEKIRRGKKAKVTEPLFPGYLFIELGEFDHNFHKVRSTFGVSQMLMFGTQPATIGQQHIEQMQQLDTIASTQAKAQKTALLQPGEEVEITDGPFKGFLAKVVKLNGNDRCIVLLDWLQQEVKAELGFHAVKRTT